MTFLRRCEAIERLTLKRCPLLTDLSLRGAEVSPQLEYLAIEDCPLGDATLRRWLARCKLDTLTLVNTTLTAESTPAIGMQTTVTELQVTNAPLVDEDFRFLERWDRLRSLRLQALPVRGEFLRWVGGTPRNLDTLFLRPLCSMTSILRFYGAYRRLTLLDLGWTPISGERFSSIHLLTSLEHIDLMGTKFTDRGKMELASLKGWEYRNSCTMFGQPSLEHRPRIWMPGNWTVGDLGRFPDGKPPWTMGVQTEMVEDAIMAAGIEKKNAERIIDSATHLGGIAPPLNRAGRYDGERASPLSTCEDRSESREVSDSAIEERVMIKQPARSRFIRPRFSLWAMLVLITVVAIPLSYVAQRRSWNLRRKAAWEFLASKGIGLANNGFPVGITPLEELTLWQRIIAEEPALKINRVMARCGSGGQQSIPSLAASDLRLFGYFPEIESLHVGGPCDAGDEAFAFLSQLQNLKSLGISAFPNVRSAFLQRLHCEHTLEGLTLHSLEKLEGENLPNLESFPVLDLFDVARCQLLNDETLRRVNLPHTIEYLGIAGSIGDETLARWLKKGTVKHLLLDTSMSRKSASVMQHQIELVSIEVTNAPWIDEDFEFLRHCTKVEELYLTSMPIEGAFLEWIPQPGGIRILDFHNTLFSDSHLAKLARFSELEELDLSWTPLSGMGFDRLKSLPEGCQLQLVGARFTSDGKRAYSLQTTAHTRRNQPSGELDRPGYALVR